MIGAIWHFFERPYLLVGTFWPKPWHFFALRTLHPCIMRLILNSLLLQALMQGRRQPKSFIRVAPEGFREEGGERGRDEDLLEIRIQVIFELNKSCSISGKLCLFAEWSSFATLLTRTRGSGGASQ